MASTDDGAENCSHQLVHNARLNCDELDEKLRVVVSSKFELIEDTKRDRQAFSQSSSVAHEIDATYIDQMPVYSQKISIES